ncbi:hypothetical protein D3C71_1200680 [compost metagenome]
MALRGLELVLLGQSGCLLGVQKASDFSGRDNSRAAGGAFDQEQRVGGAAIPVKTHWAETAGHFGHRFGGFGFSRALRAVGHSHQVRGATL